MWNTITRLFAKGKSTEYGEEPIVEETENDKNIGKYGNACTTKLRELRKESSSRIHQFSNSECYENGVPLPKVPSVHVFVPMERNMGDERRRPNAGAHGDHHQQQQQQQQQIGPSGDAEHYTDAYDTRLAKQRASVKWLLSKAYNNRVPDNLREPYYRDLEDQEHLKPQIVHTLSNAELYCMALANIYSDPNYHNQNHWGILQALARKGVYVAEPNNTQLTETILIQNSPLKMSAHMAVIEGLMVLYAKEVVTGDRVVSAIRRFDPPADVATPTDHEKGLLLWISHASHALIAKIQTDEGSGDKTRLPDLPAAKDFQSLCDGVGLAAVIAFYCPGELNWMDIRVSKRPSVADALHNLSLVHAFCIRCLPYSIFHMQPEDVTYMRGSMKQNLVVFLADMYNVLEIHPVKCVRYPGEERALQFLDVAKSAPPISVKKSQSLQQTVESHSFDERGSNEENFIVHRVKGVPTLSSVADEKFSARAEAAGRPSNWEDQRRSSYAGRRSRRNSVTDDSQLTIENFGGSQDNLHNFGCVRNPDKEIGAHVGKRTTTEPTLPARSSVQDVYGSDVQHILADNGYNNDEPPPRLRRQASNSSLNNVTLKNILHSSENDSTDGEATKMASFANLSRQSSEKGINLNYTEQEREAMAAKSNFTNKKNAQSNGNATGEKKTTFATLPNTTTWQQQSHQQIQQTEQHTTDENGGNTIEISQLNKIRLKLEEKRRRIENDRRRMEVVMSKQQQKVGEAAFLQAVTKGKVKSPSSSASGGDSPGEHGPPNPISSGSSGLTPSSVDETPPVTQPNSQEKPQRPFTLKEISEGVRDVEHKWLEHDGSAPFIETRRTPDIENMDLDQYQQSISQMNNSLSEIQADIQRLASQQNQIQQQHIMTQHQQQMHQQLQQLQSLSQQHLQNYGMSAMNPVPTPRIQEPQQSQFYLHDQPQQMARRTWGRPPTAQNLANEMAAVGYQQSPMDSRYSPQPQVYQQDPRLYQDTRTWAVHPNQQKGFVLHDNSQEQRYLNGGDHSLCNTQMHHPIPSYPSSSTLFNQTPPSSASPQHRNAVHRISQLMNESPETKKPTVHHIPITCESPTEKRQINTTLHTPVPAPSVDDMEPQNISFIGNDDDLPHGLRALHITSGSQTYRIPSPTRPSISRNSFQPHTSFRETSPSPSSTPEVTPLDPTDAGEKGFYISFDNDGPKKPKPTLRVKRASPKKERNVSAFIEQEDFSVRPDSPPNNVAERQRQLEAQRDFEKGNIRQAEGRQQQRQEARDRELQREMDRERQRERDRSTEARQTTGVGLVIGPQLANPDPNSIDEMERRKERIMLLSLQRRQQQEELKERKELEAQTRREQEKLKEETRAKKKEEEKQRRAAILEQHKLKKAIEEAEREGKVIDKEILNAIKPTKLRNKNAPSRPRPKTIHGDASADLDSGVLTPSRGKKGSSSNLSTASLSSTTMRRDYFRGSQDSLTGAQLEDRRHGSLFRGGSLRVSSVDSPDDGRGSSPCRSSTQLGRRGSCKTSRDAQEPQQQVRGRPKYSTNPNFKGRKSNSLMNLCDTDSGLGRNTPPRRAASPGLSSMRLMTSPSGHGSLPPGLMTKRRGYDDGGSDISSNTSSMMVDYNGPRLFKQPTTKSNRSIMFNAVQYCVFPGTVNQEAKQRVLDEISRSESKHFLILFRDAGCQFRALYSYCPERDEVSKLYGTGPKQVIDNMFDKFFKYNSGNKCFSQVHTKHLTVTIDAFTIHNSLWQGKKMNLPNKKDMALVI
ncbi:patronin isoform X3 [Venturia canescens]|uniref:patronin isoform X3 n=1 Tax=Venturia canescens TaxID=32260 RepID=UPI001C9CDF21|nr:patronin isoform X3 [Venturia canescens]